MGNLSNTTINGVSYEFKDAGAARQSHSHTKSQITDFPTSMPASDVYSWAKASSKPSYTASDVGAVPNTAAGVSAAINQLTTSDSAPTDNDYYVSQYAGGGSSTTTYHRRPVSKLWEYIKSKLASKGSATQPVYFSNGVPVATTYTLGKSVPADAKFTDTTYSAATTSANGLMSSGDKTIVNKLSSNSYTTMSPGTDVQLSKGGYIIIGKLCVVTMRFKCTANPPTVLFNNAPSPAVDYIRVPVCSEDGAKAYVAFDGYGMIINEGTLDSDMEYAINAVFMVK